VSEQWKPIQGWPDYEISDHGHCRSVARIVDGKLDGSGVPSKRRLTGQLLTPVIRQPSGLPCFNLWRNNEYTQFPARRLVLLAFGRMRPRGTDAVNVDGDLTNNYLGNLVWQLPEGAAEIRRALGIR